MVHLGAIGLLNSQCHFRSQCRPSVQYIIGEGVVLRYDEAAKELVGLTLIGLRARWWRQDPEHAVVPEHPVGGQDMGR